MAELTEQGRKTKGMELARDYYDFLRMAEPNIYTYVSWDELYMDIVKGKIHHIQNNLRRKLLNTNEGTAIVAGSLLKRLDEYARKYHNNRKNIPANIPYKGGRLLENQR